MFFPPCSKLWDKVSVLVSALEHLPLPFFHGLLGTCQIWIGYLKISWKKFTFIGYLSEWLMKTKFIIALALWVNLKIINKNEFMTTLALGLYIRNNIMAAFRGMHVSSAKHSYAWLLRKCDYRTDTQTHGWKDRQTPDKVIPMCRYASQATK